jgi:hypothetical protein
MAQRSETGGCQGSGSLEIAVHTASYADRDLSLFKKVGASGAFDVRPPKKLSNST